MKSSSLNGSCMLTLMCKLVEQEYKIQCFMYSIYCTSIILVLTVSTISFKFKIICCTAKVNASAGLINRAIEINFHSKRLCFQWDEMRESRFDIQT